LPEVILKAAKSHEDYTNTVVATKIRLKRPIGNDAIKTCIYRFVQEALTNAFKHAGGKGQIVTASDAKGITVMVIDAGPGLSLTQTDTKGLGLFGMRARIEAIGGKLEIASPPDGGTCLTASFPAAIDWS
jgi:signal transduction histidine kinase